MGAKSWAIDSSITTIQSGKHKHIMGYQAYKALRIYRAMSFLALFNQVLCNRIMKFPLFVSNANRIYGFGRSFFGSRITNAIINATFCKMLTAGNTIEQANEISNYFRKEKIAVILDYCAEGSFDAESSQVFLDQNAAMFARSANYLAVQQNEMISIKISGLIDVKLLKKVNEIVLQRNLWWDTLSQDGQIDGAHILQIPSNDESQHEVPIKDYLKIIHNYEGEVRKFTIDQVGFKMNHQPFNLYQEDKHNLLIKLHGFTPSEVAQLSQLRRRLDQICNPNRENATNFRILVDAEQTYVQKAIECVSEQMQAVYNKNNAYIIPTIQNYLKSAVSRSKYEVEIAKRRELKFGAKLVRGAYMVEESRLAQQTGKQNPIVDCFDKTTANYLASFEIMMSSFTSGQVIVASHNKETVEAAITIRMKYTQAPQLGFAQLLGLADHLTWELKNKGYMVYKYLPWAKTDIMIAYMIRRAQELNQMKYPLDMQFDLLIHEIKSRLF